MPQLRKMYSTTGKPMPHVGAKLNQLLKEKRLTKSWLAARLQVQSGAINQYIEQPSLHAALLWKIGQALEFDFFNWLSKEMPIQTVSQKETELQQQVADLTKENELYKNLITGKMSK